MIALDPNLAGYSEAITTVFAWLADEVLDGAIKALVWGWERAQWTMAQDRYDGLITKQYGWICIMLDKPFAYERVDPEAQCEDLWDKDCRGCPCASVSADRPQPLLRHTSEG